MSMESGVEAYSPDTDTGKGRVWRSLLWRVRPSEFKNLWSRAKGAVIRLLEEGSWRSIAALTLLFVVSFAVPIFSALEASRFFGSNDRESTPEPQLFPNAVHVRAGGTYLRFKSSPRLNPEPGRDFLFTAWFRLVRLPSPGETMILAAKFDSEADNTPGYGLALRGEQDAVRPLVYWRDQAGNGRWIAFQEASLLPRTWTLFALSLRDGHLLGLHSAFKGVGEDGRPILLGGFDLEKEVLAESGADLLIGAFNSNHFRGAVGRVGLFSLPNLSQRFNDILSSLVEDPNEVPSAVAARQVKIWYQHGADTAHDRDIVELKRESDGREQEESTLR